MKTPDTKWMLKLRSGNHATNGRFTRSTIRTPVMGDSPTDIARKSGPIGKADWPAFGHVWSNIARGAANMALSEHHYLSQDHIDTMGDLGSGHEERMKARQMWLRDQEWI